MLLLAMGIAHDGAGTDFARSPWRVLITVLTDRPTAPSATRSRCASVRFAAPNAIARLPRNCSQHRGLHSTYPTAGKPGEACVKCHSDHNGENFALLHWDPTPKGFDHTKTGYMLDGKHVGVNCRQCHQAKNIPASSRGFLAQPQKDLSQTYLGLSTQCATCHEDKHQGRLRPQLRAVPQYIGLEEHPDR